VQDFTNRSQDSPHKFQEDSDLALASIVSSIQCKLDLLINDKNYKLPPNSQPEKEFLKKVKNSLREFIHPEEGAGSKQRLLQRNDIRTCLNEIQATMFDIESLKILKQSHFEIFSSLIGSIEYSLVDFKKVCSIRGSILELSYKMLFVLMSSMIDKLLIYGDTVEKQIWTQVNKMNSTIEAQIEKISVQLAESRLREEDWKKKVELSKSETFYLAKMIRHVENNSKNVIAQMKALELEKSILANDLVNVKLELLQQKTVQRDAMYNQKGSPMRLNSSNNLGNSPGVTSHQIIPSPNQLNDELSGEPQLLSDEVHVRWQKLKDSIETQLQAKKYYLTEFEREMVNLINNGLERVKKNGITYEGRINERGQCTVDLEPGAKSDKQTQTTLKVIEQEGLKPLTADAECQASYVEMVKLQTANDHKMDSKVISRFSLIYQIKECLSLRELVDEYIFNPLNSKHPKRLDTRKMITDQLSYIIVHKDLVMKITDALDGVETLKIKYNSIGETLTTLKEENKKLQANNAEYENQNHDMTKRMEELRNKLAEAERAPPPPISAPAKLDSKALVGRINKEELTMLVADYVIEIKDKLLQCINSEDLQSNGQDKPPPSRHSIFRRDSVNAAGKKDKKPEGLPQKFLHAVIPYCEYENQEKQEVMSIDDEEEVDLINEDATPCTIFITKLLNMLKVSLAEKQPTIGIIANKGSDTKLSRVKTIEESVDSTKGNLEVLTEESRLSLRLFR
jgi:predicted nuclease with TOPRIM domain